MSAWTGNKISVEIYGESHAEAIGVRIFGFPAFSFDKNKLNAFLSRRASGAFYSTARRERDLPSFSFGEHGEIRAEIANVDVKKSDYDALYARPRPSHADFVRFVQRGVLDFSGGGAFSGRMTAPFCVVGGIALQYLALKGIEICAYVSGVGEIQARSYKDGAISREELLSLREGGFPSLEKKDEILAYLKRIQAKGDSVGGTAECIVYGVPAGLGDCLFGGLEGKISSLLYAIPAVKGTEFGDGFRLSAMCGSVANDPFVYRDGRVQTSSNRSGGINGGVSNGMPISFAVAFRPTPSISIPQRTVDLRTNEETEIAINGRHDACIVPRALPVVESAAAIALADEVLTCGV